MMNAMDRAERERQEHRGFDRGSVVPQGPAPCQKGIYISAVFPILTPLLLEGCSRVLTTASLQTRIHTHMHARLHACTNTYAHTHRDIYIYTHVNLSNMCIRTRVCMHMPT